MLALTCRIRVVCKFHQPVRQKCVWRSLNEVKPQREPLPFSFHPNSLRYPPGIRILPISLAQSLGSINSLLRQVWIEEVGTPSEFNSFTHFCGEHTIQTLFIIAVAAAEAAIGLAILVVYFRNRGSIAVEDINMMKG